MKDVVTTHTFPFERNSPEGVTTWSCWVLMLLIIMVVGCTTTILADISDMEKAYEFLLPLTLVTVTIYSNQDMMGNHAHLAVTSQASSCNHQAIALADCQERELQSFHCLPAHAATRWV